MNSWSSMRWAKRASDRPRQANLLGQVDLAPANRKLAEARVERAKTAEDILVRLRARKLYKAFYTERHWSITSEQKEKLTNLFAPEHARHQPGRSPKDLCGKPVGAEIQT